MENINTFRRKIVMLLGFIFLLNGIIIYIGLELLHITNILSFSRDYDFKSNLYYSSFVGLLSVLATLTTSKIWFNKIGLSSDSMWIANFIRRNSKLDILTGLNNKKSFQEKVQICIENEPNKIGGLLYIDIDNIKYINNKYSHDIGDRFITKLSEALKYFEKYNGILGRVSGDEFVVYLHGFENQNKLVEIFKEFYKYSENLTIKTDDGLEHKIHFSSGLTFYPKDATIFEQLDKYADFALFCAKTYEKGTIVEFNREEYNENYHLLENSYAINHLLENKLVKLAYQPIVDLKTGEIFAYEALMRSKMENFKSPLEIIDVATTQAKLQQLESLVIFTAFEDISKNEEKLGDRKVFINSLPSQVLDHESTKKLVELYEKHLNKVVVEITEQASLNKNNLKRKWEFVEDFGLELAIDDFGSGFSNERRILDLEPSIVKVDMNLIQGINHDKDKQIIVRNLVEFCQSKNIKLVAEGVENSKDLKYIIDLGIDYVQGYYLARPNFEFLEIPKEIKAEIIENNDKHLGA